MTKHFFRWAGVAFVLFSLSGPTSLAAIKGAEVAKSTVGNGGDAYVCRYIGTKNIAKAEVFDLMEARLVRNVRPNVPSELASTEAVLTFVLDRYAEVDKEKAEKYRKQASTFQAELSFSSESLLDVPDNGDILIATASNKVYDKPCALEQLAIQKKPSRPSDRYYVVQKEIWEHWASKHNYLQAAAITLHEVVYRDFIEQGYQNSEAARYFNSSLFAGTFNSLTPDEYQNLLKDLEIK